MDQGVDLELAQLQFGFEATHLEHPLMRSGGLFTRPVGPLLEPLDELGRQIKRGQFGGEIHARIIPANGAEAQH